MQGRLYGGASIRSFQGVASQMALLFLDILDTPAQPDDVSVCLLKAAGLNKEEPSQDSYHRQIQACREMYIRIDWSVAGTRTIS